MQTKRAAGWMVSSLRQQLLWDHDDQLPRRTNRKWFPKTNDPDHFRAEPGFAVLKGGRKATIVIVRSSEEDAERAEGLQDKESTEKIKENLTAEPTT